MNILNQLDFSLFLLKIIGGFPYNRCKQDEEEEEKKGNSIGTELFLPSKSLDRNSTTRMQRHQYIPNFKSSAFWSLMKIFVVLLHATNIVFSIISVTNQLQHRKSISLAAASVIDDVVFIILTSLLGYHFLSKSSSFLVLVSCFYELAQEIEMHALCVGIGKRFGLCMVGFACAQISFLGWVICLVFISDDIFFCHEIFEGFHSFISTLFSMIFYEVTLCLICEVYDNVNYCLKELDSGHNSIQSICPLEVFMIENETSTKIIKQADQGTNKGKTVTKASVVNKQYDVGVTFRGAERKIVKIHQFQRLLHDFLGFPIAGLILAAVITQILLIFRISVNVEGDAFDIMRTLLFLATSFIPVIVFNNAPLKVLKQVDNLRLTLSSLRRVHESRQIKEKCDDLLKVMDGEPGFKLCHVFTLDRSTILSIISSCATYIIILIQFQISEFDNAEKQTNNTTG